MFFHKEVTMIPNVRIPGQRAWIIVAMVLGVIMLSTYHVSSQVFPSSSTVNDKGRVETLIAKGEEIFFHETFNGNGRTCGTCHRREANFTIDPAFIATLPDNDPLFVAEFNPDLKFNFENPTLMREFGLIQENLDGFDDLEHKFVMRGVPHVLAQRTSVNSTQGPRTGWSGDGAPGDGSLRSFATGAVTQHFTKTLNRVPGVDFRLPTEQELDALEAFMLSLGRQQDLTLPLPLKGYVARRGQELFMDDNVAKCNLCHANAGATATLGGINFGNINFETGVENLPDQPADLAGQPNPLDGGLGRGARPDPPGGFGDGTFNVPSLVEAADTGPFFHNNAIRTIEGAVSFYDGDTFNNSPAGQQVGEIELDGTQIEAIAAFLRVINALENIRESIALLERATQKRVFRPTERKELLERAVHEMDDSINVLAGVGLHLDAVAHLKEAKRLTQEPDKGILFGTPNTGKAITELKEAQFLIIEPS
jgi:cytochrome c peroxidase